MGGGYYVKTKCLGAPVLHAREVVVEVSARAEVEHEEELAVVLEREVHARDERVLRGLSTQEKGGVEFLKT